LFEDSDKIYKAVVSLTVEKTLRKTGKITYEKVIEKLSNEYYCYLTDCHEHPEYLNNILEKFFGNIHNTVMKSIKKDLEQFREHEPITKFLGEIDQ